MSVSTRPEGSNVPAMIRTNEKARALIAPFLPPDTSLERVAATVQMAVAKNEDLLKCTPASVVLAVARIASWGLVVGETAHLVPFGAECTAVADYKGLIEMIVASGAARHVEAHCVYAKEPFKLRRGTVTDVEHDPIGDPAARGPMVGAYAIFHLRPGLIHVEYMAVSEIDEIRQSKSRSWKKGDLPAWYARKTVVRRGAKYIPKTPKLAKLLQSVDAEAVEVPAELADVIDAETGEVLHEAPRAHRGPRPIVEGGYGVPVAPGSVNDHPEADRGEYHEDHADGELALGPERTAPTRRDAMREGR